MLVFANISMEDKAMGKSQLGVRIDPEIKNEIKDGQEVVYWNIMGKKIAKQIRS